MTELGSSRLWSEPASGSAVLIPLAPVWAGPQLATRRFRRRLRSHERNRRGAAVLRPSVANASWPHGHGRSGLEDEERPATLMISRPSLAPVGLGGLGRLHPCVV